eukprot:1158508-Pelagomonas_calceolata.AAC.32
MLLLVPSIRSCKQTPPKQRIATATRNKIIQQSVTQKRIHTHRIQQSVALSPMFLHQNPAISDPKKASDLKRLAGARNPRDHREVGGDSPWQSRQCAASGTQQTCAAHPRAGVHAQGRPAGWRCQGAKPPAAAHKHVEPVISQVSKAASAQSLIKLVSDEGYANGEDLMSILLPSARLILALILQWLATRVGQFPLMIRMNTYYTAHRSSPGLKHATAEHVQQDVTYFRRMTHATDQSGAGTGAVPG